MHSPRHEHEDLTRSDLELDTPGFGGKSREMTIDERKGIVWPIPANYRTNDFDLANVTPDQVRTILRNVRNGKLEDQDRLFRLMLDTWPRLRKALT